MDFARCLPGESCKCGWDGHHSFPEVWCSSISKTKGAACRRSCSKKSTKRDLRQQQEVPGWGSRCAEKLWRSTAERFACKVNRSTGQYSRCFFPRWGQMHDARVDCGR